jgi:ribosomal protein S18 acetylase RimI-like enzyme
MSSTPTATELDVRKATIDDLDTVVKLLHDAYDWLIEQGITDQWIKRFSRHSIEQIIGRGEVYVASGDHDVIIATFTLSCRPDPELWGHPPDDAGYIRRLVVDRDNAGHDLGAQLLDHASQLVAATGREWLRLDCAKHNTRLQDYYRSHGFEHVGTIDLPHRQSGARFQRRTEVLGAPANGALMGARACAVAQSS